VIYLEKLFYCYSKPLKDFLVASGCFYFTSAIHNETKKKFWLFNGTEKLNSLLSVWRDGKKK